MKREMKFWRARGLVRSRRQKLFDLEQCSQWVGRALPPGDMFDDDYE